MVVKYTTLCDLVDKAVYGLEYIFFDRNARDAGAWALISDDGTYKAIGPKVHET